jgi:hypothetical protein
MNQEAQMAESAGAPNLIQRIVLAFTAPFKLGEALRKRWPWVVPLVIIAAATVLILVLTPADLFQQAMEAQGGGRARGAEGPSPATMRWIAIGSALVMTFVSAAVVAGVLYLVFNVFFGQADTRFAQHLSAVSHAWWILLAGSVLQWALQLAKHDGTLRLGLGLLLADAPASFSGYMLSNITLFGLWSSAALGVMESGLAGGKVSAGKAAGAVLVLYLIVAAVSAVFRGLGGAG